MHLYDYTHYRNVVVCGDIHGRFEVIYGNIHIENSLIIVAGDCGFGFNKPAHYDHLYTTKMSRCLNKKGNTVLFVRGNHDDPAYFDGHLFAKKRAICIPDYAVVRTLEHTILCIGGATSIDRLIRKAREARHSTSLYWTEEQPVFSPEKIQEITDADIRIDTVITHTCPSFCEPTTKIGLEEWIKNDQPLADDVRHERQLMDSIWYELHRQGHPVRQWWYGHFHFSHWREQDGCYFRLLDVNEMDVLRKK